MAELVFHTGPMDCGKSTLALQLDYTQSTHGRKGRVFTSQDRAGAGLITSRLGLSVQAIEVDEGFDFWRYVIGELTTGKRVDYIVCDEAQFYTRDQIDQLARIVDELQLDVYAFGILVYEIWTNCKQPYEGLTPKAAKNRIISKFFLQKSKTRQKNP